MKIFGLHWAGHLVYLVILGSGFYWGINKLEETTFLKIEIGEVQQLTIPVIRQVNEQYISNISRDKYAWPTPGNVRADSAARQALQMVNTFSKKCDKTQIDLRAGTAQDEWSAKIVQDYYLLGDSLKIILPQDSVTQSWLGRCLFADYPTCSSEQLVAWLTKNEDTWSLLQNLALKAELALNMGLTSLQKRMLNTNIPFDAVLPAISYNDCPRAGQPFEAYVYAVPYSTSAEGMSLQINDQPVVMSKGLGHYQANFEYTEQQDLFVKIIIQNLLTGEIREYVSTLSTPGNHE